MILFLIFSILLAIVASLFAIQNSVPVTVAFFNWRFEGSLAIIILLSTLVGILMSSAILLPLLLKRNWQLRRSRNRLSEIEKSNLPNPVFQEPFSKD